MESEVSVHRALPEDRLRTLLVRSCRQQEAGDEETQGSGTKRVGHWEPAGFWAVLLCL